MVYFFGLLPVKLKHALEEELGCPLLERKPRSFSLTPAGEAFLRESKQIMRQVKIMVGEVKKISEGRSGSLRLSFVGSALYGKLPAIIRKFRKKYSGIKLELRMATSQEQYEMLLKNETDIAVLNEPLERPKNLSSVTFDEDRLCIALPLSHPLAVSGTTLADLKNESFIIWPRAQGSGFYDKVITLCGKAGFSPHIIQEAHQMQAILSLVAVEAGLAIIPQSMSEFKIGEIMYLPIQYDEAAFYRSILFQKNSCNATINHFIEMAEEGNKKSEITHTIITII